jgi:K+-sensing histidine kinase KdpD
MLRLAWRYGLAIVTVAAALVLTILLEQYTDITILFYAAVVVSAWFGGMGPGLLAVILSGVSIDYFFVPPLYTLALGPKPISFLVVFGVLAMLTSWMSTKRQQADYRRPNGGNERPRTSSAAARRRLVRPNRLHLGP